MIDTLYEIDLGRSALDEAAVAELERIATDLIPSFVQALKPWSAWHRGATADTAGAAVRGCTVIPFRCPTGGANPP